MIGNRRLHAQGTFKTLRPLERRRRDPHAKGLFYSLRNTETRRSLRTLFLTLPPILVLLGIVHILTIPAPAGLLNAGAVWALAVAVLLVRFSLLDPSADPRWALPAGGFVAVLVAVAVWLLLRTVQEPVHVVYYAVLMLGGAFFIVSVPAYLVIVLVALGGFAAAVVNHGFDEHWLHAGAPLLLAAVLGAFILSTRIRSMAWASQLRHRDEIQKNSMGSSFRRARALESQAITEQPMVQREREASQEMDRMKDELISVVGHELKTPLASIHGSLRLIEGTKGDSLPPEVSRLVQIASRNSGRLTRLVNDLLDVEQMRAGRLELEPVKVRTRSLVHDAVAGLGTRVDAQGVRVEEEGDDVVLEGDRERLVQALTNLLSNAVKYSPSGGKVRVRTWATKDQVRFEVTDEGPGIPEGMQDRLFQRFSQLDSSDSRAKGGSGLGLVITRSIVEAHGGEVGLQSTEGEGSTFFILLPLHNGGSVRARPSG